MSAQLPVPRLVELQARLRAVIEENGDDTIRRQFHADLSPLAWHLRHCAYVESYWIREVMLGDSRATKGLATYCMPEHMPKSERAETLPEKHALVAWAKDLMADNAGLLSRLQSQAGLEPYDARTMTGFLINHHGQHLETMGRVLTEIHLRAMSNSPDAHRVWAPLEVRPVHGARRLVPAATHRIGAGHHFAFDNERPAHSVALPAFEIAAAPVTNGAYLAFMEDGGYGRSNHWSAAGWAWRAEHTIDSPHTWQRDEAGAWFEVDNTGPRDLDPDAPVKGLSRFEAGAFAKWAGARLPHEIEWEAARRRDCLDGTGQVWEWCANDFHPYPGFAAFPYREYSVPWFDLDHGVLRGGSRLTEPEIRRPSFRNYYPPENRHIWAGLRLAY